MSFPYMHPQTIIFVPSNAQVNIAALPIFKPIQTVTITGVTLTSPTALNVSAAASSNVTVKLLQLANASNIVANLSLNSVSNLVANVARELVINTTLAAVATGTGLGLEVILANVANQSFGTAAMYQIDYVQGSPGSEG